MRFTCDGTLTQLIYRTLPGGSPLGSLERFGLWRSNDTNANLSTALGIIAFKSSEVFFRNVTSEASLYSINDLRIPVQANYHLGLATVIPSSMQFLNVGNVTGSNFYFRTTILSVADLERVGVRPLMPLITAVVSCM